MKEYPAYKDSGYEWIGEIPNHWRIGKLKYFSYINPTKDSDLISKESEALVTFLPMEKVNENGTYDVSLKRPTKELWSGFTYFEENDVIVAKITPCFENGKGALLKNLDGRIGFGSTEFHVLRAWPEISHPKFLYYLTQSHLFKTTGEAFMYGAAGQKRVPTNHVTDFPFSCPPYSEQQVIADFLDCKTAQIDSLSEKKQRQIDLLQEQRTALINHAVTKGLNPDAPMKDSAVEWLGEIPSTWKMIRLRHISPNISVGLVIQPSQYVDPVGTVPFLFGSNVRENAFLLDNVRKISEESNLKIANSMLHAGDLVTVRVGYPGVTAVVPPYLDGANCASMMVVRKSDFVLSEYLCYVMNSRVGMYQVETVQYGAAQKQFNISHAVDFVYPIPPVEEQEAIVNYLTKKSQGIYRLIGVLQTQIERLQEYRTALISEAVTGKIDVR